MNFQRRATSRKLSAGFVFPLALLAAAAFERPTFAAPPASANPAPAKPADPKLTPKHADSAAAPAPPTPAAAAPLAAASEAPGEEAIVAVRPAAGSATAARENGDELFDRTYVFIGARYRGNLLPEFMLSPFLKETGSLYLNQVGVEVEFRTNRFSIIPSLSFAEYSTGGDKLVFEAGKQASFAGNWSVINSSLKAFSGQVDFLWSKPISRKLDFEFGFGIGVSAMFDTLKINWIYEDPAGEIKNNAGNSYSLCKTGDDTANKRGCSRGDHSNSKFSKVSGFEEPSWFNGGSKPNFLPNITLPALGLRYKPAPQVALRIGGGFSLTGFWFGVSGSYGLSKPLVKKPPATAPKNSDVESEEVYQ